LVIFLDFSGRNLYGFFSKNRFPMKKLLFSATFVSMALSGFAQGTIEFQNLATSPILYSFDGVPSTNRVASGNIPYFYGAGPLVVGLFWGTSAGSVNNLAATAFIGPNPGSFNGNASLPILGTNPGDTDWFEVIAWDSAFGTTLAGEQLCLDEGGLWTSANSTQYGVPGGPLQFTLGPNPYPGTPIFGSLGSTGVFHLFYLDVTPEPSTIGLSCLGALALLLFRRRK
jgi:hypothetical protein